jgi:glutaredoxin 2
MKPESIMKLYQYNHCPYCVRVKMMLGRKKLEHQTITIAYDDIKTPTEIIGKKLLPILIKQDNTAIGESLDILKYLDNLDHNPILSNKKMPEDINNALFNLRKNANKLYKPRIVHANIEDFSTKGSIEYYENKFKKKYETDFEQCLKDTKNLVPEVQYNIDKISALLTSQENIYEDVFAMADIHLFPALRNLTIVKNIKFPSNLKNYMYYQAEQAEIELFFDQAI